MEVLVRWFAGAAEAAECHTETVAAASGISVSELLAQLGARSPKLAHVISVSSVLVDGKRVADLSTSLAAGTTCDVLPPFAGG